MLNINIFLFLKYNIVIFFIIKKYYIIKIILKTTLLTTKNKQWNIIHKTNNLQIKKP